jgi:hypothetical protein
MVRNKPNSRNATMIDSSVNTVRVRRRNNPAHINEASEPVDNLGGLLSVVLVGTFVLSLNFLPVAGYQQFAVGLLGVAVVAGVLFVLRQRRAPNPLYDLQVARRPTFWVAAVAGIIVFGALMGAMFIGQRSCRMLASARCRPPAGCCRRFRDPRAPRKANRRARGSLPAGWLCLRLPRFLAMLLLENAVWVVALALRCWPASACRAPAALADGSVGNAGGMASGTADPATWRGDLHSLFGAAGGGLRSGHGGNDCGLPNAASPVAGSLEMRMRARKRWHAVSTDAADHGGGQDLVPGRRSIGLYRGHHRGVDWRGDRFLCLPEAR